MKRARIIEAKSLKPSDIIFLNDFENFQKHNTYYVECYSETEPSVPLEFLQVAQILENSRTVENLHENTHIRARTQDNRALDIECDLLQKFSTYLPERITARALSKGDIILLRGEYNPAKQRSRFDYTLIALKFGYESKILSNKKTLLGKYRLKVLFGGVKKIRIIVDPDLYFELAYISSDY